MSINELNGAEQEGLQDILERDESSWTEAEVAHLTARVDYLSGDDKARLSAAPKPSKKAAKAEQE